MWWVGEWNGWKGTRSRIRERPSSLIWSLSEPLNLVAIILPDPGKNCDLIMRVRMEWNRISFLDVYNKTVWIVQQSVIQSPNGKFQVKQVPIGLPRCTVTRKIGRHCIDRENTLLVIMVTLGTEVQMLGGLANVGTKKSIFRMLWYLSSAFST